MVRQGGVVVIAAAVLAVAGLVRADMMPVSGWEVGLHSAGCVTFPDPSPQTLPSDASCAFPRPEAWTAYVTGLPAATQGRETVDSPAPRLLIDHSNSFDLCLYALMGLGVLRSGTWVRRSSLGSIPEWYLSGVSPQIGHSHVAGPDLLCRAAVGFVRPDDAIDLNVILRHGRDIVSLWRCAQFTPAVLAGRAPPMLV